MPNLLNFNIESSDEEIEQPKIPEFKKEEIKEDAIFDTQKPTTPTPPPSPKKKVIIENDVEEIKVEEVKPKVKLTKTGKPRKQMTPEQKAAATARLAKAREARKVNKVKNEEAKKKEKKKKELLKEKEDLEFEELEEEVKTKKERKTKPKEAVQVKETNPNYITKEDLAKAQFATLHAYENLRKERKKKKKEEQQIKQYQDNVMNTVNKLNQAAIPDWMNIGTEFANCF